MTSSVKIQRCIWRLLRLRRAVCRTYAVRCALVCPSVAVPTPTQRSKSSQRDARRRTMSHASLVNHLFRAAQRMAHNCKVRTGLYRTRAVQPTPRPAPRHTRIWNVSHWQRKFQSQLLTPSPPLDTHCTAPVLAFLAAHTSRRPVDARSRPQTPLTCPPFSTHQLCCLCWSQRIHKSRPCSLQRGSLASRTARSV